MNVNFKEIKKEVDNFYKDIDFNADLLHKKLKKIGKIFEINFLGIPVKVTQERIIRISNFYMPISYYKMMHKLGYLYIYPSIHGTYVIEIYDEKTY